MPKFWLYGCATNNYEDQRYVDLINIFDTFEIAKGDAQWRYAGPQDSPYWINYARILQVDDNLPVQEWRTPDQPIDDGLLPTLEFTLEATYPGFGIDGIPEYWGKTQT